MALTPEQEGLAAQEFVNSLFFKGVLQPWMAEQNGRLVVEADKMIFEDAPKNRFAVNSGYRRCLQDLNDLFETLVKRSTGEEKG